MTRTAGALSEEQILHLERYAFEAMQWAKANNVGADQPSLVFARRFAFLLADRGIPIPAADDWLDMDTAPKDGSHFLVHYIDLVDEYDEDDRLIARQVPTPSIGVASQSEIFGLMDVPYQGRIVQGRRYTKWRPLPAAPNMDLAR